MSDVRKEKVASVMKRPRYMRALLQGTVLACVWLLATLSIAAILPTRLPPIDPQLLKREREQVRSWEQVEKVHKAQMEGLHREASNPFSLTMRQIVNDVTRGLYIVPVVIILLGFAARSEAAWLSQVIFLFPSVALAALYLLNIELVIYIIVLPLAFLLFNRSRNRDSIT